MNKGEENHHLLGPYDEPGIILDYSHILSHLNLTANVEKLKREHVVPSSKTWKWFDLQDLTQVVVEKADSRPDTWLYCVCAFFNPTQPHQPLSHCPCSKGPEHRLTSGWKQPGRSGVWSVKWASSCSQLQSIDESTWFSAVHTRSSPWCGL